MSYEYPTKTSEPCRRRANAEEWGALGDSARDEVIDRALIGEKSGKVQTVLPLPFGATEVFPRLRVATGQRKVAVAAADDAAGSQGEDVDSASSTSVSRGPPQVVKSRKATGLVGTSCNRVCLEAP